MELMSIDRVIEKLQKQQVSTKQILDIVNSVFTYSIDEKYILLRHEKIRSFQAILNQLLLNPGITQRTEEWYEARKQLITASDFAQALGEGKFGTQKDIIKKKSGYEVETFNANLPPLKWGIMFEPVACDIYCQQSMVKIHEFGLLIHQTIDHLGASPDGISELGIMLEIKCPYMRKITGVIPDQYYYQIQAQLEVCNLEECDYLECEFQTYTDIEDIDDLPHEKGIICEDLTNGTYEYSPAFKGSIDDLKTWLSKIDRFGKKTIYWHLRKHLTIRVKKDPEFLASKLPELSNVWNQIQTYKSDKELYIKEIQTKTKKKDTPQKGGYMFID